MHLYTWLKHRPLHLSTLKSEGNAAGVTQKCCLGEQTVSEKALSNSISRKHVHLFDSVKF